MALLEAKKLGISFGGLRAVDDFNISIEKDFAFSVKFYSIISTTSFPIRKHNILIHFQVGKNEFIYEFMIFFKFRAGFGN